MSTTTLKISDKCKARIARLAKTTRRSAHSLMIEALEREVAREERLQAFVREAGTADVAIDTGEHVFRAEDVHVWLERLAAKRKPASPKPWRK